MGFSPCRPNRSSPPKASRQPKLMVAVVLPSPIWCRLSPEIPLREGEAPAEPMSTVRVPLSFFAHTRSPGIPARPPPTQTNPQHRARLPFTHPFRALITTQQKLPSASSPRRCSFVVAWASARVVPSAQDPPKPSRQRKLTGAVVCM